MTIHSRNKKAKKIQIDLSGNDGNVFVLIGISDSIGQQLRLSPEDRDAIRADMMSSDYEHAVATLEKNYGAFIDIYEV